MGFLRKLSKSFVMQMIWKKHQKEMHNDLGHFIKNDPSFNQKQKGEKEWASFWSTNFNYKPDLRSYRVFSRYIGENKYIVPNDICRNFIEPVLNPGRCEWFYNDKNTFGLLIDNDKLPVTLYRCIAGKHYDGNYNHPNKDFLSYLKMGGGRIIVKPASEAGGRGVTLFERTETGTYIDSTGNILTLDLLDSQFGKDWLIQKCCKQSEFMSQFNPSSINTIRVNTYRDVNTGEIHVLGAVLRIGNKGSIVDNACSGGRFIGINKNGILEKCTYDHRGTRQEIHNGINFKERTFSIPNWDLVKDFAIYISQCIPHMGLFAHDIYLDENNQPKLIEVNSHLLELTFLQTTQGPFFGEYTDDVINYCKANIKKLSLLNIETCN